LAVSIVSIAGSSGPVTHGWIRGLNGTKGQDVVSEIESQVGKEAILANYY